MRSCSRPPAARRQPPTLGAASAPSTSTYKSSVHGTTSATKKHTASASKGAHASAPANSSTTVGSANCCPNQRRWTRPCLYCKQQATANGALPSQITSPESITKAYPQHWLNAEIRHDDYVNVTATNEALEKKESTRIFNHQVYACKQPKHTHHMYTKQKIQQIQTY